MIKVQISQTIINLMNPTLMKEAILMRVEEILLFTMIEKKEKGEIIKIILWKKFLPKSAFLFSIASLTTSLMI